MPMNDLLETKMFRLLSEPSQVTNQEMQSAYENFVTHIATRNQSDMNLTEAFRKLNLTRIEFDALDALPFYEQGGKCPSKSIPSKSTDFY